MKVPAVVIVLADNQQLIADRLAEAGAVVNLGRAAQINPQQIADQLTSLCRDADRRRRQIEAGRRLVDGRGPERVAAAMRALDGPLPEDQLELRPARAEDMLPLWRLVNDPTVRQNSLKTRRIPLEEHARWFNEKLTSRDTAIWVLDLHGLILAPIRYDREDSETAGVSLHVAAPFRQRGLATKLLDLTWRQACEQLNVKRIQAVIRRENTASQRTFLRAGFGQADSTQVHGQACYIFERAI